MNIQELDLKNTLLTEDFCRISATMTKDRWNKILGKHRSCLFKKKKKKNWNIAAVYNRVYGKVIDSALLVIRA